METSSRWAATDGFDAKSVNRAVAVDVTGISEALKNIYHADRLVKELTPLKAKGRM